jgi:rare lipoprotein A
LKKWIIGAAVFAGSTAAAAGQSWVGKASYYGYHGRTASGGHVGLLTAAHRSLPFGSRARVTNLGNGHSVVVTINDRGPFVRGRVIDVSVHAAQSLGFRSAGVARVKVERISAGE